MTNPQPVVLPVALPEFSTNGNPDEPVRPIKTLGDVKLAVSVIAGSASMTLGEARALKPGDVIALDRTPDATVDIFINGRYAARGDLIVMDDRIAAKLAEIAGRGGVDG